MKYLIPVNISFGLIAALVLFGCGGEAKTVAVPIEMPPVYFVVPKVVESETGCLNLKKEAVPCEEIVPIQIPNPYKDWGWNAEEYQALIDCKAEGGKMGSSKNCRKN